MKLKVKIIEEIMSYKPNKTVGSLWKKTNDYLIAFLNNLKALRGKESLK